MSSEIGTATIPKPPDNADIHEMYKWMLDMYTWAKDSMTAGQLVTFFTQDQINQMTDLSQAGKIFFNHTTGKFMGGEVESNSLSIKTFTTS